MPMPNTLIRLSNCPPQPWKNGMGRTREIATEASGADQPFLWRVSVAEVDSAAPFSRFPGIDRQIVLLEGAGFHMTLDGDHTHALCTPFEPFAFPGEAAVQVQLAGGATRDFNLMVRRARAQGTLEVWRTPGAVPAGPSLVLVYCARGSVATPAGVLAAGDSWRAGGGEPTQLVLAPDTVALAVHVQVHD